MARCTRCGRHGNFEGDLCGTCQSGVTYHYVERPKVKKIRRERRGIWAWWGALYGPVDKKKLRRNTVIFISAAILLLAALIFLRPGKGGNEDIKDVNGHPVGGITEGNS